ncbi:MAG: cyclic nucleotide-binding domain-containing protein [Alphaproteobacteria bacterium]|nr:MAG: cyclic nucleotide-binding domain-containing protein [Alphaproteobacteria bacterium]
MIELSRIDPTKRTGGLREDDFQLLKASPLFKALTDEAIISLISDGHIKTFDRKTTLFVKGEQADRFYLVLEGWVKLTRESLEGQESIISVFAKGETFAEAAVFSRQGYPVNAITVSQCRLLVVPASSTFRAIKENSEYALNIVASMARHMHNLVKQIEQLSVQSSTERLANFLLSQCPKGAKEATIYLPIEKSLLAGRLGMQPETLSRSFAKLRKLGLQSRGNKVTISNIPAIRSSLKGN